MILRAVHKTVYEYATPASESHNEVRLMPIDNGDQKLVDFKIHVNSDVPVYHYETTGGVVHHFGIRPPHNRLEIVAEATVETFRANPFDDLNFLDPDLEFYWLDHTKQNYAEFLSPSRYVSFHPRANEIAKEVREEGPLVSTTFLMNLSKRLNETLSYDPDVTHVHSTLDEVIQAKGGVCQDFAHLMIACARSQGIPARYVSGYLFVNKTDTGMRGEEATHAWIEALLPDGRWVGFDPTNNLLVNDRYVKVHIGRDYADVAPTKGVYVGTAAEKLYVEVHVDQVEAGSLATR